MPIWVLLVCLSTGLVAAESELQPAAVVARILAAGDARSAAADLAQTYAWTPDQVAAVLALDLARLAELDAAGLAALLAAHAEVDDRRLIDLATKRVRATEGMVLPTAADGDHRGHLAGDVRFELDALVVAAERIDFSLAPVPGGGLFLDQAQIRPATDGRVRLDTRASRFAGLDFRGLLEPRRITVTRLADAGASPDGEAGEAGLRYRVELADLGAFTGTLRDDRNRWLPVAGNGRMMELAVALALVDGRPAGPRIAGVRITGGPDAPASIDLHEPRQVLRVRSSLIVLHFAPDGGLERIETGTDSEIEGRPHVEPPAADGLPPAVGP